MTPVLPPSPGVGARRRATKNLPKLPLSAFSPPNTGTSEHFPLAPSPSSLHPDKVVDAHVVGQDIALSKWKSEIGQALGNKLDGAVLSLQDSSPEQVEQIMQQLQTSSPSLTAVLVPLPDVSNIPAYIQASKIPVHFVAKYKDPSSISVESAAWALAKGHVIDIDVANLGDSANAWEALGDFIHKAYGEDAQNRTPGTIVLSNVLPPPHSLDLPIVKLLNHSSYLAYQRHVATLSLVSSVHVKFLPPTWDAPTPASPPPTAETPIDTDGGKEAREWKRRIKMYLGHAVEVFGFERIIFGTSPSSSSSAISNAGYWYELARESLAELGVEKEDLDKVFCTNARRVYSSL